MPLFKCWSCEERLHLVSCTWRPKCLCQAGLVNTCWVNSNPPPHHCTPTSSLVPLTPFQRQSPFGPEAVAPHSCLDRARDCKLWRCCFQSLALAVNVQQNVDDAAEATQCVKVFKKSVIGWATVDRSGKAASAADTKQEQDFSEAQYWR